MPDGTNFTDPYMDVAHGTVVQGSLSDRPPISSQDEALELQTELAEAAASPANFEPGSAQQRMLTARDKHAVDVARQTALAGRGAASDQDDADGKTENALPLELLLAGEAAGAGTGSMWDFSLPAFSWRRSAAWRGIRALWKGRKLSGEGDEAVDAAEAGRAEEGLADAREAGVASRSAEELGDARSAVRAGRSATEIADATRAAEATGAIRDVAEIGEVARLSRFVKVGGVVGIVASFFVLPAAAEAAVRTTAPKGESAARTDELADNAATYVAFTDPNARRSWKAGNYGTAIRGEADKTYEDTKGFVGELGTEEGRRVAWAKTKSVASDLWHFGGILMKDPKKFGEDLRAAVKDEHLVQSARDVAGANPQQAVVQTVIAAAGNQGVTDAFGALVPGSGDPPHPAARARHPDDELVVK